jgi:hypothetical protein
MSKEKNYDEKIGFLSKPELKEALENYADTEGISPSVVCRKALVDYLMSRGALKQSKNYLWEQGAREKTAIFFLRKKKIPIRSSRVWKILKENHQTPAFPVEINYPNW